MLNAVMETHDLFEHAIATEGKRRMHPNSLIAYSEESCKLSKREKLIYGHLVMAGKEQTVREIKEDLFGVYADRNKVAPRVTKLVEKGYVREVGKAIDHVTGKQVGVFKAVNRDDSTEQVKNKGGNS